MPRHRKAHGRMPWTLHRGENSWRSVLPGSVLPGILAAARRAARRPSGPGEAGTAARGPGRERLRLARLLMVTPWFAASAGIVIAAALAVHSPAALMYVPNGPAVRCATSGCAGSASGSPGVTTEVPGVKLKTGTTPQAGQTGVPVRHHAVYQLGYRVVRSWPGGFVAVITLPADLKPGTWSLRFGFPSARVDHVWGARWRPSRHGDAGTATGSWRPHGHDRGLDDRQLMILAVGTPTLPSGCRLDGVRCEFTG